MSFCERDETPIYHLLGYYNNEALTHGVWLATFIVSTFAFMGLALYSDVSVFGWSSFLVLLGLSFLMTYVFGRLMFWARLASIAIEHTIITSTFQTMSLQETHKKVMNILRIEKNNFKTASWFAWQYSKILRLPAILISFILGFAISCLLFFLISGMPCWLASNLT